MRNLYYWMFKLNDFKTEKEALDYFKNLDSYEDGYVELNINFLGTELKDKICIKSFFDHYRELSLIHI